MNRREFVRLTGGGVTVGALSEAAVEAQTAARPAATRAATRARMKVGTQHGDSDEILKVLAGFGVNHICCHPQDPGMPKGKGWRGVETVLGSVEGLKRFVSIAESPYHGLNFCQGTVSEMLERPGEQIFDVIRDFGTRKKIFNVHFRNISGGFLNFRETFVDDGDVDMLRAMRVYRDIGYDGMMMPDHVPTIEGDTGNLQGCAFALGDIKALIAAVSVES